MNSETKLFLGIILATVVIIGGSVFAFSRPTNAPKVDPKLLIANDSYAAGPSSASVTMVEFGDFQCPACGAYHTVVKKLQEANKDTLRLVFRHYPLPSHPNALPAARAVEAAGKQGKFWEMYDRVYTGQREWSAEKNAMDIFKGYAKELNLNVEQLEKDAASPEIQQRIDRDVSDADVLGINATPTFYINGEKIANPASLEDFDALIKAAAAKSPKPTGVASESAYHVHANMRVVLDGKPIDFSQAKYQSEDGKELNEFIHFHDGVGSVFHVHKKGMKLADLFGSLGMSFTNGCFVDDARTSYCSTTGKSLKFYVNGQPNSSFENYEPMDLDRILVSYGSEDVGAVANQIKAVPDDACVYSEKCPERGTPPSEECVGGLGTECK